MSGKPVTIHPLECEKHGQRWHYGGCPVCNVDAGLRFVRAMMRPNPYHAALREELERFHKSTSP